MKEYKAIDIYGDCGRQYVQELNKYFDNGWEFVELMEIGNARGGLDDLLILSRDRKDDK